MGVSESEDRGAGGVSDRAGVGGVIREGRGISGRREGEGGEGEGEGEGGRGEEELAARGLGGVSSEPFISANHKPHHRKSLKPPPSSTWLPHFEENDDKCFHSSVCQSRESNMAAAFTCRKCFKTSRNV